MGRMRVKDPNFDVIADASKRVCPGAKVILFGSRARRADDVRSDYDVLVVLPEETLATRRETIRLATEIRKGLADALIPADVIVETHAQAERERHVYWTVVHDAFSDGVQL